MKNKIIKILFGLLFVIFNCNFVKADANVVMVDTNYNTAYRNDDLDMKIGFDYSWFEGIVLYDDDTNDGYAEGDRFQYKMNPFYISYDNTAMDIELQNMEIPNENYVLINYYEKTIEDKTILFFEFDIKEYFDQIINEEYDSTYNGIIDDIILKNIKLKISPDAYYGTYFIESGYGSYGDYENDENYFINNYPISIINNKKNEKTINNIITYRGIESQPYETVSIEVEPNKKNYNAIIRTEYADEAIYTMCNTKCKIRGIGSHSYIYRDINQNTQEFTYNFEVEYDSSEKEKYTIINDYESKIIDAECLLSQDTDCIVIIGNSTYGEGKVYFDKIKDYYEKNNSYYNKIYYYEYDKLKEVDKQILHYVDYTINPSVAPHIYKLNGNGYTTYSYTGFILENKWSDFMKKIEESYVPEKNEEKPQNNLNIKDLMDSSLEEKMDELEIKYKFNNFENFVINNSLIIISVLGGISFFIFVIIIVFLLKNKKIKKQNKILQQNQEINSSQVQEEQNKTLE